MKKPTPKKWQGRFVRISDVAAAFGVSVDAVRYWIKKDKLRCQTTLGGHRRILKDDFDDLVKCLPGRTGCPPLKFHDHRIITQRDASLNLVRRLPQTCSYRGICVAKELAVLLKKQPGVLKVYAAMRPSCRKKYSRWVMEAKHPATKLRRAGQAVIQITAYGQRHGLV